MLGAGWWLAHDHGISICKFSCTCGRNDSRPEYQLSKFWEWHQSQIRHNKSPEEEACTFGVERSRRSQGEFQCLGRGATCFSTCMSELLQILECSCASIILPLVLNRYIFIWGRWMYWWQSLTTLLVWACSLGAYFASGMLLQSATHIEWTYVEWNYEQFCTASWESDILSSSTEVTLNPSLYLCAVISSNADNKVLGVKVWENTADPTVGRQLHYHSISRKTVWCCSIYAGEPDFLGSMVLLVHT